MEYLGAALTLALSFGAFGNLLIRWLKLPLSRLEELTLSFLLGISVVTTAIVGSGHLFGTTAYGLVYLSGALGLLSLPALWKRSRKIALTRPLLLKTAVLFCSILLVASTQFMSGIRSTGVLAVQDHFDTLWHVALGQEVLKGFPPAHPSDPTIPLQNYHYFFDVFLASLHFTSGLSFIQLNYQVAPLVVVTLLALAVYSFGKRVGGEVAAWIAVFLTFGTGSFAFMIPWFLPGNTWTESSFWVSQTFASIVNPQLIYTLAILVVFFLLQLPAFTKHWKRHLLLIVLLSSSIGFKSYGWILMSGLYAVTLLLETLQTRRFTPIGFGLLYLAISTPFIWLITGFKTGSFFYKPFWFLDTMVEAPDRLNLVEWKLLEDHYRAHGSWLRVTELKLKEAAIFFGGNLGIRTLGLGLILAAFKTKLLTRPHAQLLGVVVLGFLAASLFPLFFLQTGTVWNSIQFWYYALLCANCIVILTLPYAWMQRHRLLSSMIGAVLIMLAVPTTVKTLHGKLTHFVATPAATVRYLSSLSASDVVLICPDQSTLFRTPEAAALTTAHVLANTPDQLSLVNTESNMIAELNQIFSTKDSAALSAVLKEHAVTSILCSDHNMTAFIAQTTGMETVFTQAELDQGSSFTRRGE